MDLTEALALIGYKGQLALTITSRIIEVLDEKKDWKKSELKHLIGPNGKPEIDKIADRIAQEIFDTQTSIWNREKEKVTRFMKEQFNYDVCWDNFLPYMFTDFSSIEGIPVHLSVDDVLNAYSKTFGEYKIYCTYYTQNKTIEESITTQQERPTRDRFILHRGGQEVDKEHLKTSYDIFSQDNKTYMIPIEGIMAAFRFRCETGKMMDIKGVTRFHALDSNGSVLYMHGNDNNKFYINSINTDEQIYGSREIISL